MEWIWVTRLVKSHSEPGPQSLIWGWAHNATYSKLQDSLFCLMGSSSLFVLDLLIWLCFICAQPLCVGWLPFGICPCQGQIEKLCPTKWGNMYSRRNEAESSWLRLILSSVCGSSAGMGDVNSPAPDCQYPELFNQTPAASPLLSLVSVHSRPQTQNNFQTRQIKGKMERECHSLTLARWQHSMQAGNSSIN